MPVSHRKFGDLLEEGIKRVHITRKKPIGYILDEFGYELRPDDSSKGRHAIGHWYYKKRIPASMDDVAKLAGLIVTNSDVERDWLRSFLDSAGYPEAESLCDRYFLSQSREPAVPVILDVRQMEAGQHPLSSSETKAPSNQRIHPWKSFAIGAVVVIGVIASIFLVQRPDTRPTFGTIPTSTHILQLLLATATVEKVTITTIPVEEPTLLPPTPTSDFSAFDGNCPTVTSASVFEYASPQSFEDFLNGGGSFVALQSGFNALVQKKVSLRDGRIVSTDLTGDDVPEVIISAILEKGSVWKILGCHSGQYDVLVDINDPESRYLRFAVDLNGNKLPEIISYRQTQAKSTRLFEFFVQEWNGNQFVDLIDSNRFDDVGRRLPPDIMDWQRIIANATITTSDTNGDGLYEVVITGGLVTPVPTCETRFERPFTEVWAWNGKTFQLSDRTYIPPIYRFQRAADGDLAFALKKFDAALDAYRDVIFDVDLFRRDQYLPHLEYCKGIGPTIDTALVNNEQEQLTAYARWRILLINAITDSPDAMQVVYQTLLEKFPEGEPGHSYAIVASAFWEEYQTSQDVQSACEAANSAAGEQNLYPNHTTANICFIP